EQSGHALGPRVTVQSLVDGPTRVQEALDLLGRELWAEVGALLRVSPAVGLAWLGEMPVPDELGHAERSTRVAGGRLDPELLDRAVAEEAPLPPAVLRHTAREAEPVEHGLLVHRTRHSEHGLFAHVLNGPGEVHLPLCEIRLRLARRPPE